MSSSDPQRPHRPPEPEIIEPEIIPAGCDPDPPRGPVGLWMRVDGRDGMRHIVIARPGPAAIVLGLLVIALIAAVAFFLLAGILLVWIPILIAGILLALAAAAIRHRWQRVRAWWANARP